MAGNWLFTICAGNLCLTKSARARGIPPNRSTRRMANQTVCQHQIEDKPLAAGPPEELLRWRAVRKKLRKLWLHCSEKTSAWPCCSVRQEELSYDEIAVSAQCSLFGDEVIGSTAGRGNADIEA